jgi:hypothetical protein
MVGVGVRVDVEVAVGGGTRGGVGVVVVAGDGVVGAHARHNHASHTKIPSRGFMVR